MGSREDLRDRDYLRNMLGLNEWDEPIGTPSPLTRPVPNIRGTDRVSRTSHSDDHIRPSSIGEVLGTVKRNVAKEGMILGTVYLDRESGEMTITNPRNEAREVVSNLAYMIGRAAEVNAGEFTEDQQRLFDRPRHGYED